MHLPRVLITRSPHQASELAERLRALSLDPILIPTIELAEPTTFAPLDAALAQLLSFPLHDAGEADRAHQPTFHWLLFTSANAAHAFHHRLSNNKNVVIPSGGHSPQSKDPEGANPATTAPHFSATNLLPSNLKIAAIGPATAHALEAIGLHPDLIPPQAVAESLAHVLLPHAIQSDGAPTRFLLIRAETARDHLPQALRAAGARVTIAPAYRTIVPPSSIAQLQSLFSDRSAWPDAITFTSSSTAQNLQSLLETSGLTLPPEILRISIGPITSQTLRDLNLPPHAEAEAPTIDALATAVAHTFGLR